MLRCAPRFFFWSRAGERPHVFVGGLALSVYLCYVLRRILIRVSNSCLVLAVYCLFSPATHTHTLNRRTEMPAKAAPNPAKVAPAPPAAAAAAAAPPAAPPAAPAAATVETEVRTHESHAHTDTHTHAHTDTHTHTHTHTRGDAKCMEAKIIRVPKDTQNFNQILIRSSTHTHTHTRGDAKCMEANIIRVPEDTQNFNQI
jgi:hypothetical protein